jgi:hypothetical protein
MSKILSCLTLLIDVVGSSIWEGVLKYLTQPNWAERWFSQLSLMFMPRTLYSTTETPREDARLLEIVPMPQSVWTPRAHTFHHQLWRSTHTHLCVFSSTFCCVLCVVSSFVANAFLIVIACFLWFLTSKYKTGNNLYYIFHL